MIPVIQQDLLSQLFYTPSPAFSMFIIKFRYSGAYQIVVKLLNRDMKGCFIILSLDERCIAIP
jgi:hypothetical protein